MSALAELTLTLCRIPSQTGHEAALADFVVERARAAGLMAHTVRRGNGVVIAPPNPAGLPRFGLFGHTDTVGIADDQPLEIRDGRVFGCGASDMKSGLAVMLTLLERLDDCRAAMPVFVFYDKEEGPLAESGLPPLFDAGLIPPDLSLGLCLEPTDNRLQAGCMGGMHVEIVLPGRRAHSARPWQGDNALYQLIPLLERLRRQPRREVVVQGLSFYEVMTPTTLATSNSRNVVPDAVTLNVNLRFAPGKSCDQALAELRAVVGEAIALKVVDAAPAGAVCLDQPQLAAWRQQLGLAVEAKQAWTDVAQLTARGLPAANFGPGETAQAHQARESVPVANLEVAWRAIAELFGR